MNNTKRLIKSAALLLAISCSTLLYTAELSAKNTQKLDPILDASAEQSDKLNAMITRSVDTVCNLVVKNNLDIGGNLKVSGTIIPGAYTGPAGVTGATGPAGATGATGPAGSGGGGGITEYVSARMLGQFGGNSTVGPRNLSWDINNGFGTMPKSSGVTVTTTTEPSDTFNLPAGIYFIVFNALSNGATHDVRLNFSNATPTSHRTKNSFDVDKAFGTNFLVTVGVGGSTLIVRLEAGQIFGADLYTDFDKACTTITIMKIA